MDGLDTKKLTRYFQRNLELMPTQYTPYDSSRTSLVYFCLGGLALLGDLGNKLHPQSAMEWVEWVYSNLVDSGEGFRGSSTHKDGSHWDMANIAGTFFSISMLALLGDDLSRVDRDAVRRYVSQCQRHDGTFAAMYNKHNAELMGDRDPRYTYMAVATCRMLGGEYPFDVDKAVASIHRAKSYDGGLGDSPGGESHSGMVFCSIAALSLLGRLDVEQWRDTTEWILKRQGGNYSDGDSSDCDGGFNGRINKPLDTCYSFWNCAALKVLGAVEFVDMDRNRDYLLTKTQHGVLGGFGKVENALPDPMHSFLGLAALTLKDEVVPFNAPLSLPQSAVDRLDSLYP